MKDVSVEVGFEHPMRRDRVLKKRGNAFAGLITSIALLLSIVVVVTAVSIGIARAGTFATMAESDNNPCALAAFLGLLLVAMGGITAAMTMRNPHRD